MQTGGKNHNNDVMMMMCMGRGGRVLYDRRPCDGKWGDWMTDKQIECSNQSLGGLCFSWLSCEDVYPTFASHNNVADLPPLSAAAETTPYFQTLPPSRFKPSRPFAAIRTNKHLR